MMKNPTILGNPFKNPSPGSTGTKWMVVWAFSMRLDLNEWLKSHWIEIEVTFVFGSRLFIYYIIHFEPPRGRLKDDYRMT